MLPLPKALQIERDYTEEQRLLDLARKHITREERTGIHMSDIMDSRLAYFKWLTKQPVPDRLINMFVVGQALHAILLCIKGGTEDYQRPPDSGTKHFGELQYSPDFLEMEDGSPNEIKTTRSFYLPDCAYLPDDKTYHMYLEQLVGYMASEDKLTGRLTLLYLNSKDKETNRTAPSIFVFKVTCTPEQLAAMRAVITKATELLAQAKEEKNHKVLPLCRPWKCNDCEFWDTLCKPEGRYEFGRGSKTKEKQWTA